jgi:hypothetical protein
MNEDAAYTKNDLAQDDLASRLKAHPNYLSQIINEKEGKNFFFPKVFFPVKGELPDCGSFPVRLQYVGDKRAKIFRLISRFKLRHYPEGSRIEFFMKISQIPPSAPCPARRRNAAYEAVLP